MRICIFSFPFGTNYGGNLQCYALKSILEQQGHQVTFLRYMKNPISQKELLVTTFKTYKSKVAFLKKLFAKIQYHVFSKHDYYNEERQKLFDIFRSTHFSFTPMLNSLNVGSYMNDNFDAVIVGSDQVWTDLTSKEKIYFIDTAPEFQGYRIAYAACSAHKEISKRVHANFLPLLEKFDFISVRDKTTAHLVSSICGKNPNIVPDPTELYSFIEFLNKKQTSTKYSDYILCYVLGSEIKGGYIDSFRRIRDLTGIKNLKVVNIVNSNDSNLIKNADENLYAVTPDEWIRLIANAKCVFTDSFHATLFAMKFGIPFVAYYKEQIRSSRMIDLKNTYKLKGIVNKSSQIKELSIYKSPTLEPHHYLPDCLFNG